MKMRYVFFGSIVLSLCLFAKPCNADYSMKMPNRYEFVECNSVETVICPPNSSSIIFTPYDYPKVGPIKEFATTNSFIFLRTAGRKLRNRFAGDTYEEVDDNATFYFIIATPRDTVAGPFSFAKFQNHADVKSTGKLNWESPRNPLIGTILWIQLGAVTLMLIFAGAITWYLFKPASNR